MAHFRSLTLFLLLGAVWGTAFVAIKAGLAHYPPVLFAAIRYDLAGVVLLAYAAHVVDDPLPRSRGQWALVGVGATLLIATYHTFLFVGQQHTTAAAAAVLVSLSPILTTGFARVLVPSDALAPLGVVGVFVGLAGVVVIIRPEPGALLADDEVLGQLLVFVAATSFALGSVLVRRIEATLPIETMQAWSMLGGAALMHVVSLGLGEPIAVERWLNAEAIGALAYLALVASALGFLLYFELLDRLGAVEINMVSYVAPIVAAVVGWVYLGEVIDAATVLGFVVIVVGFALVKRRALASEVAELRAVLGARRS